MAREDSRRDKYTVRAVLNEDSGGPAPEKKGKAPLSPLEQAKRWAMEYLKNPHSEKELRDRLTQKGCRAEDIDAVCALCLDYGFLDDGEYAAMIVRHYAAGGYGPGRIKTELTRRGIPRDLWDRALLELPEGTDAIDRLLASKLRGQDPSDRKARDKAAAALFRKGYSWEDIRSALGRYGAEDEYE